MSRRTLGPWMVGPRIKLFDEIGHTPILDPTNCIYVAWIVNRNALNENDSANASLIAAAPELLDSLKELIDLIEKGKESPEDLKVILENAKSSVLKAEGGRKL